MLQKVKLAWWNLGTPDYGIIWLGCIKKPSAKKLMFWQKYRSPKNLSIAASQQRIGSICVRLTMPLLFSSLQINNTPSR